MSLATLPFFERLAECEHVLIAGAGGGHDVLCGIPLYFHLIEAGKKVTLANLSFSNLYGVKGRELLPQIIEVGPDAGGTAHYFPERYLSEWFASRGDDVPVWCFHRTGVIPLAQAYRALVEESEADAVVLVDGGCDSLLRGDEEGLGTPHEDMASLAAVAGLKHPALKLLLCVGFGVDAHHGVSHAQILEAIAALSASGGYLGATSLLAEKPEVQRYVEAVRFVAEKMPSNASIVAASVSSAIEGEYGDVHSTSRTAGSTLWINPLMSLMWAFEVGAVAERCLYLDALAKTRTYRELSAAVEGFRSTLDVVRPRTEIPI